MKKFGIILSFILLCSCNKDDSYTPIDISTLDKQLLEEVFTVSDGKGNDFFILPSENDLSSIPQDPLNPLTPEKVALGKLLVHETATGGVPKMDGSKFTYACASCHPVASGFYSGTLQGIGEGGIGFGVAGEGRVINPEMPSDSVDILSIKVPSLLNVAYQDVMLWNGALGGAGINEPYINTGTNATDQPDNLLGFEGLEVQGMAGQTAHRLKIDEEFAEEFGYKAMFDAAFPEVPENERYSRLTGALAIASFNRTVLANQAPWQEWLKGDFNAISEQEKRGAITFMTKGKCISCHTGPSLKSNEFYALGMGDLAGINSTNSKSFKKDVLIGRAAFTNRTEDNFKFKVPNLYNLTDNPFYGHGGTFTTVREVIEYINIGVKQNGVVPDSQLAEGFGGLNLTSAEIDDLTAFIEKSLYDPNLLRYVPAEVISGFCFPNNDEQSRVDLGCN